MKMKCFVSGFDGFQSYEEGVSDVAIDHARQVFVSGHGVPVNADGNELALDEACDLFRLNDADRAAAMINHGE